MAWYPFDVQTCTAVFIMDPISEDFVKVNPGDLKYNENITLNIYKINSITMNAGGNNNDGAIIEFVLSRGLQNIALNTYLPTGLLLIIAVATTWFKDDYFDTIIGVNLTLMLVLVTMFDSVSS